MEAIIKLRKFGGLRKFGVACLEHFVRHNLCRADVDLASNDSQVEAVRRKTGRLSLPRFGGRQESGIV